MNTGDWVVIIPLRAAQAGVIIQEPVPDLISVISESSPAGSKEQYTTKAIRRALGAWQAMSHLLKRVEVSHGKRLCMQERQVRSKNELRLLRSADADRKPIGERLGCEQSSPPDCAVGERRRRGG